MGSIWGGEGSEDEALVVTRLDIASCKQRFRRWQKRGDRKTGWETEKGKKKIRNLKEG